MNKIAAFIYHDVTDNPKDSGFQNKSALAYTHPKKEFMDNLNIIRSAKVPIITINDLAERKEDAIMLTFDDGGKSSMYIAEQLDKHDIKGHFFITTNLIGKDLFVNKEDIKELYKNGHIIGSHSHTHPFAFYNLPIEKMLDEWRTSKYILEDIISDKIICCSVPGGDADYKAYLSAKDWGYQFLFDSEITMNMRHYQELKIIGRVCPKQGTDLQVVKDYANFKGFAKARNIRAVKKLVKRIIYPVYTVFRKPVIAGRIDEATNQ